MIQAVSSIVDRLIVEVRHGVGDHALDGWELEVIKDHHATYIQHSVNEIKVHKRRV